MQKTRQFWLLTFWLLTVPSPLYLVSERVLLTLSSVLPIQDLTPRIITGLIHQSAPTDFPLFRMLVEVSSTLESSDERVESSERQESTSIEIVSSAERCEGTSSEGPR